MKNGTKKSKLTNLDVDSEPEEENHHKENHNHKEKKHHHWWFSFWNHFDSNFIYIANIFIQYNSSE